MPSLGEVAVLAGGRRQATGEFRPQVIGFDDPIHDVSEARWTMSMSRSNSSRLCAMKRSRSAASSIAWILLKYTALIAGSGPITAMRAVGRAMVASGSKPGPAIAYRPAP